MDFYSVPSERGLLSRFFEDTTEAAVADCKVIFYFTDYRSDDKIK